ncbi:unnamed protein product [Microthlaspi erraticum]|uniref:Large ribosomal subunit protein bL12 C-terminal domain-containing protein n=1 Tax=Microthlaspi erraticum TaxID=1685480 RepID=A0A6D2KQS0_9BRAS|nr:unnamed protein product [Microthlaspi erraticum]CAA7054725.1 unnamed protein product [Microthlaspi erraticum]
MLAFRNAGVITTRFVQGRRVITSLASFRPGPPYPNSHREPKPRRDWPLDPFGSALPGRPFPQDPFGWPLPRLVVREAIERLKLFSPEEKVRFGHIISELLGLPKPPEPPADGKFAVKLVEYDPDPRKKGRLLREVAWAKATVKVMKDMFEIGLGPSIIALRSVPCVIKEGITKEEANEIIAKINAVGGVAVLEPPE